MQLNYVQQGVGHAVVLLHPIGLNSAFWGNFPQAAAQSFRIIAVDLRGHGRSNRAEIGLKIADYADDVERLLDELQLEAASIVGVSFGGMIGQIVAARKGTRVKGLVACGCPARIPESARSLMRERGLAAQRDGMASVIESTIKRWFNPEFHADEAVHNVEKCLNKTDPGNWSAGWHAIAEFDCLANLGAIKTPSLVIAGERDLATSVTEAREVANGIPGAIFNVMEKAPHMMQIECCDLFTKHVCEFLKNVARL